MILVDDRTGSKELAPLIVGSMICRLEFGDFAFSGNGPDGPVSVGIERKTIWDLINSMTSGRLSGHQLVGLSKSYDWVYIVVEGVWRSDAKTGILQVQRNGWRTARQGSRTFMARDIHNFINSIQVICNVLVIQTGSKWETAQWITSCHSWWQKKWDKHKSHMDFRRKNANANLVKPNVVTRVAAQLDGVGFDKSRKLGRRFGSVVELVMATREELMEVEGIGGTLADKIISQMRR